MNTVKDLKPRSTISIWTGETLRHAAEHLADDDIGALVVYGGTGAIGIFSERDLARSVADGAELDEEPLDEYMTAAPITIDQGSPLGDAIAKMNEFGVRHLVTVEDGDPVGVISTRDLLPLFNESDTSAAGPTRSEGSSA